MEPFYTPREVAKLLGLSYQQVILRCQKGTIKAHKVGWGWIILKRDLPDAAN